MPVSQNAFKTGAAKVNRESLANVVDVVQRSDTPIYSMIENTGADATFEEWPVRAFEAPSDNSNDEGADYEFDASTASERVGNYMQIFRKSGKFTNTQEAVKNAGDSEKMKTAKLEKAMALKTDVEYSLVASNASVGGDSRKSGSLVTFAETNVSRGAGGANGGYDDATKLTVAPTDGTQRAFTKSLLDDLLQTSYSSGAKLANAFLSPYAKRVFASFMSDPNVGQFRYAAKGGKNTLVGNADVYLGPLGEVTVHPNFVMGGNATLARNVIVLDTKRVKWKWLRKIAEDKDLAKTGDYKQFVIHGEGGVMVSNEKAVGVIADTFGLTAST